MGFASVFGVHTEVSKRVKLNKEKLKRAIEFNYRRRQASRDQKLATFFDVFLKIIRSYAPVRSGALRRAHYVRLISNNSKFLTAKFVFGFEFTSEMVTKSTTTNRPEGWDYGNYLHENPGWVPQQEGVGARWLIKAWRDTKPLRKRFFVD